MLIVATEYALQIHTRVSELLSSAERMAVGASRRNWLSSRGGGGNSCFYFPKESTVQEAHALRLLSDLLVVGNFSDVFLSRASVFPIARDARRCDLASRRISER